VTTVLFVGAGRHQRRAIEQASARGLRVAAVDRNSEAPGLASADIAEVVDFMAVPKVDEIARRVGVDGVLTVSADRAVPVVAAVAEDLGLAGIGTQTAHLLTHKRAMRNALTASELPQPPYASFRSASDVDTALAKVAFPAVLKPVDSGGVRDLPESIAESPTDEALLEEFVDGVEMNGIVITRNGEPALITLSDRLRPPGIEFGDASIHVYPPSVRQEQLRLAEKVAVESARALGLRDAIAFPQLIASPDGGSPSSRSPRRFPVGRWPTSCGTRSVSVSSKLRCGRRSARTSRTRSRSRSSSNLSRSASSRHSQACLRRTRIGSLGPCSRPRASSRRTRSCRSARPSV
jgi:carbamoylphosphate synthase large subunit